MYITIKSLNKTLGKYIEYKDLYIGIPALFIFLIIFSFTDFKLISFIYLSVMAFLLLPVNLSKKNRMYKLMTLVFSYIFKHKFYIYFH